MHVIMHRGNRPLSCQRSIGHIKLNGNIGDILMSKYSKAGKALIDGALEIYNKLKAVAKDPDNLKGTAAERKSMQASQDKAVVNA